MAIKFWVKALRPIRSNEHRIQSTEKQVKASALKHPTILMLVLALFASSGASHAKDDFEIAGGAVPEPDHEMVGGEYYTRHGLRQEKNRWRSTNYGRGTLVPINTKVRVDDITSSTIRLTIVASELLSNVVFAHLN
jgi:hypothetical protein